MASNAAGDLLAGHVAREDLPSLYSNSFLPERWCKQDYRERVAMGMADKGLQI